MLKLPEYLQMKKTFLLTLSTFFIILNSDAQNITFDAKGLVFLSDADMSAFSIIDGKLRKSKDAKDEISTLTFPLSYGDPEQIKSDKASNSVIGSKKSIAITSNQKLAYVLEAKGETAYNTSEIDNMETNFPAGKYVTVVNIENLNSPKSLYRFPIGENPTSITIDQKNKYLAITCEEYGKEIQLFELDDAGKPMRIIKKPQNFEPGRIVDLVWHSSGDYLAYINQDEAQVGLIKVLRDGPTQQIIRLESLGEPLKIGGLPSTGRFTPDGKYFLLLDKKKELSDKESNAKGELFVIRFNPENGAHFLLSKSEVGENPMGFDIHPEGNYILTNNLERSFYPPEKFASSGESSISVIHLSYDGKVENKETFPIQGILPASVVLDKTGKNVAFSVFQYLTFGFSFGGIEFLTFNPQAKSILTYQKGKIYVPRGVNSIKVIKEY
jgi:DNA-binding beta-propeller fold protein YncE